MNRRWGGFGLVVFAVVAVFAGCDDDPCAPVMLDAAVDAEMTDAFSCPATYQGISQCSGELTCEYGSESCCGQSYPSTICTCDGGSWSCYATDYCLLPTCGEGTGSPSISVAEVALTDPEAAALNGIGGLSVEISMTDPFSSAPIAPVYGTGALGSCSVYHYQVDASGNSNELPRGDAGAVTVGGPALRAPLDSPCTFDTTMRTYECVVDDKNGLTASVAAGTTNSTANYTFAGIDFTAAPYYLKEAPTGGVPVLHFSFSGFTEPANNGSFTVVGTVPGANDTLVVHNSAAVVPATSSAAALRATAGNPTRDYVPAGGSPRDYLNGGVGDNDVVTIANGGSANAPGFASISLKPAGQGFVLDSAKGQPHQFPVTAQAIEWSCGSGDGVCGPNPEVLTVFRVSGRTTSAPLVDAMSAPLPAWEMPAPPPNSSYATFNCTFISATAGTMPAEAVAKVLETNPTRIETHIEYVSGTIVQQGQSVATIFVGHGLIGHTTF